MKWGEGSAGARAGCGASLKSGGCSSVVLVGVCLVCFLCFCCLEIKSFYRKGSPPLPPPPPPPRAPCLPAHAFRVTGFVEVWGILFIVFTGFGAVGPRLCFS